MSVGEILVVLLAALILLGKKNLPEAARTLGQALRDMKRAWNEVKYQIGLEMSNPSPRSPYSTQDPKPIHNPDQGSDHPPTAGS